MAVILLGINNGQKCKNAEMQKMDSYDISRGIAKVRSVALNATLSLSLISLLIAHRHIVISSSSVVVAVVLALASYVVVAETVTVVPPETESRGLLASY